MTTEHVSVPRELFDMAREQIERQRLAALEYGLIAVAEAHSYALHKIDAILSRATPSDDDFYCCNGVDCGCQGITKREYAEACSKKTSAPRVVAGDLVQQLRGRAEFLRDMGQIKSPQLMEQAVNVIESFDTSLPAAVPDGEVRLWDTQWMNIVNHDNCYSDWSKDDAVAHAVKMTEQAIARNVADGKLPPKKIYASPKAGEES